MPAVRVRDTEHSHIMALHVSRRHAGKDKVVGDTMAHLVKLSMFGHKMHEAALLAARENMRLDPELLLEVYHREVRA